MITFKEFLSERGDIGAAIRAARIHGNKDYRGGGLSAGKGDYIPLKKVGHHSSVASAVTKYDSVGHKIKDKQTSFNIKDLHATQPFVKVDNHEKLKSKVQGGFKNAHVITHKGKHYVADGHHEIMGARLRGEKTVTVRHTNLDEI